MEQAEEILDLREAWASPMPDSHTEVCGTAAPKGILDTCTPCLPRLGGHLASERTREEGGTPAAKSGLMRQPHHMPHTTYTADPKIEEGGEGTPPYPASACASRSTWWSGMAMWELMFITPNRTEALA